MNVLSYLGRGIAHERAGIPCQDALSHRICENGNWVMALADGAGSARWAAEAAQSNVHAIMEYFDTFSLVEFADMEPQLRSQTLAEVCMACLKDLQQKLEEPDLRHLSATLVFAVVSQAYILLGHLGDGMAVALDAQGNTVLYSGPEQVDGNERATYFTSSAGAAGHLRLHLLERSKNNVDHIVLTSDGAYDMFRNRGSGDPLATVRELQHYVNQQGMAKNHELADVLNQMAEIAVERMDDWSVVVWSEAAEHTCQLPPALPHSMLEDEQEKYAAQNDEEWGGEYV